MATDRDRDLAKLMGAHLVALSKATSVYQAELAKLFLGIEDEDDTEAAGPAYKMVRELEQVGAASSFFDQSPDSAERRMRSLSGANAVLFENWLEFVGQPWRTMLEVMEPPRNDGDDKS